MIASLGRVATLLERLEDNIPSLLLNCGQPEHAGSLYRHYMSRGDQFVPRQRVASQLASLPSLLQWGA
jgi:hypothetical protein